jgi:diguanylate cyclase (GGDEF)-like protein/PAS domain S-box-containing protein
VSVDVHPLLDRQLHKVGLDGRSGATAEQLYALLAAVSRSYRDVDQERYLLERSQDLANQEMVELNSALRLSEARMASLLSLSSDWVWEQDPEGRFTFVSDDLLPRTGIAPDRLLGLSFGSDGSLRMEPDDLREVAEAVEQRTSFHHVTLEVHGDAESRYMRISGAPVFDGNRCVGYRGVGSDVTERVHAERKILDLARYDALTGLPNRAMFLDAATRSLVRARRTGGEVALLFIDLDRFKYVNDTLGHAAGDAVLAAVAARFRSLVRDTDVLARLGGDEFVVIAEMAGPETSGGASGLDVLARRLIAAGSEPIEWESHRLAVAASVGIAVFPRDGDDAHALLRAADAAMYHAKHGDTEMFTYFSREVAQRASHRSAAGQDPSQRCDLCAAIR